MEKKLSPPKSVLSHIIDFLLNEGLTLITGAALGATIALALCYKDATDFWTMVGSMLAGLGTVGLLAFGWFNVNDWKNKLSTERKINIVCGLKTSAMKASTLSKSEGRVIFEKMEKKYTRNRCLISSDLSDEDQREINRFALSVIDIISEIYMEAVILCSIDVNPDRTLITYRDSVKKILHELFRLSNPEKYQDVESLNTYCQRHIEKMPEAALDKEEDLLKKVFS
jgi:hypothetical protein